MVFPLLMIKANHGRLLLTLACATYALACFALLTHGLEANRQYDTQMMTYAFQFLQALRDGEFSEWVFSIRKYPLLPSAALALLYVPTVGIFLLLGLIPSVSDIPVWLITDPAAINFVSRGLMLASAIGIFVLLPCVAKKLLPQIPAAFPSIVLLTSFNLLLFSTAVRPHVLVAFMTLLAFSASLSFIEKPSRKSMLLAFGAAILAWCTMQQGILAFIFPLWALLKVQGRQPLSRRAMTIVLCLAASVLVASIIGYQFLWNIDMWNAGRIGFGLGNEDYNNHALTGQGFFALGMMLVATELPLAIFVCIGGYTLLLNRRKLPWMFVAALLFLTAYAGIVGIQSTVDDRMYLAILPFLALIAGAGLARTPRLLTPLLLIAMALHLKMAVIALRPDTYQVTHAFIETQAEDPIATDIPFYFLDVIPTRESLEGADDANGAANILKGLSEDLPGARTILPTNEWQEARTFIAYEVSPPPSFGPEWTQCLISRSSPYSDQMFQWTELHWAIPRLFSLERMGPNTVAYCKK